MIDKIIKWFADKTVSKFHPSTLLKIAIIALIISLPISLWLGSGVIIAVLVGSSLLSLVNEYLYAKDIEDELKTKTKSLGIPELTAWATFIQTVAIPFFNFTVGWFSKLSSRTQKIVVVLFTISVSVISAAYIFHRLT